MDHFNLFQFRVLGVALVTASGQLGAVLANIGGAVSFGLPCAVVVGLTAIALESKNAFFVQKLCGQDSGNY